MRNRFLMGLVIGLMVGFVVGIVTRHFWTLLFIAAAIGILVMASRITRHKFFPPPAAGQ
jgi:hypothetical protein